MSSTHYSLGKSDNVFHKIAKSSEAKKEHKTATGSSTEKLIPLADKSNGDDDFKEFNN